MRTPPPPSPSTLGHLPPPAAAAPRRGHTPQRPRASRRGDGGGRPAAMLVGTATARGRGRTRAAVEPPGDRGRRQPSSLPRAAVRGGRADPPRPPSTGGGGWGGRPREVRRRPQCWQWWRRREQATDAAARASGGGCRRVDAGGQRVVMADTRRGSRGPVEDAGGGGSGVDKGVWWRFAVLDANSRGGWLRHVAASTVLVTTTKADSVAAATAGPRHACTRRPWAPASGAVRHRRWVASRGDCRNGGGGGGDRDCPWRGPPGGVCRLPAAVVVALAVGAASAQFPTGACTSSRRTNSLTFRACFPHHGRRRPPGMSHPRGRYRCTPVECCSRVQQDACSTALFGGFPAGHPPIPSSLASPRHTTCCEAGAGPTARVLGGSWSRDSSCGLARWA